MPVLRCSAPFLKWTKVEQPNLDRRTRKLFKNHNAPHPKNITNQLYLQKKEGLLNALDCDTGFEKIQYAMKRENTIDSQRYSKSDPNNRRIQKEKKEK